MSFVQKAAGFLLLPLYTKYLSPDQFGVANVITASATIYIMLFSMALDDAVARYYFIYKSKPETRAKFLGSIVLLTIIVSAVGSLILIIFKSTFFGFFVNEDFPTKLIFLGIISIATSPLYAIQQKINIIEEKPFHYTLNTFTFFILNTFFCVLFIVEYEMGALGLLLASAIVQVIFYIYSFIYLHRRMKFIIEFHFIKEALKYSIPLIPNRVSSWGLVSFNKIFLGKSLSNAAVGIYNVANYFGLIITVLASSVSLAYQPFVFKMLDSGKLGKETLEKVTILLISCFSIFGLLISSFSKDLLTIFINHQYVSAASIIPMIVWGETVSAISTSYIYILFYYKNAPKYISYSTILAAIINIGGCIVLVPILGIEGAVISLFFSSIISAGYKYYYAQKISGMNLHIGKIILVPAILFTITLLIQYYPINLFLKLLLLLFVSLIVVFLNKKEIVFIFKKIF